MDIAVLNNFALQKGHACNIMVSYSVVVYPNSANANHTYGFMDKYGKPQVSNNRWEDFQ